MKFLDKLDIKKSQRITTKDGYLVVPATISKIGVFDYLSSEIGLDTSDSGDIKKIARTENSLFSDETIKSFENVPITINHPNGGVSSKNWKLNAVGNIRNVARKDDALIAEAWIYDDKAINLINDKKLSELSCGYDCDLTNSSVEGADYEMTPMLGNHVAIVARGRCGETVRLADEEKNMTSKLEILEGIAKVFGIELTDDQKQKVLESEKAEIEEAKEEVAVEKTETEAKADSDKQVNDTATIAEIAKLRKQIADMQATAQAEKLRASVLIDAKETFPAIAFADSDNVKEIKSKAIQSQGLFGVDELNTMSDEALDVVYALAKKQAKASVNANVGKHLLSDSKQESFNIDLNKLYRGN